MLKLKSPKWGLFTLVWSDDGKGLLCLLPTGYLVTISILRLAWRNLRCQLLCFLEASICLTYSGTFLEHLAGGIACHHQGYVNIYKHTKCQNVNNYRVSI